MNNPLLKSVVAMGALFMLFTTRAQTVGSDVLRRTEGGAPPPPSPFFLTLKTPSFPVEIETPAGRLSLQILPVSSVSSLSPAAVGNPGESFRPPTFFSAPTPTGSGARALAFAGAFTASPDDATASSWNPAGLVHLETPEASAAFRFSRIQNHHRSTDPNFQPDDASYDSSALHYVSLAWPFYMPTLDRLFVVALNHQEAYDFSHRFRARSTQSAQVRTSDSSSASARSSQTDIFLFEDGRTQITARSDITTTSRSQLEQKTSTRFSSDLRFLQEGAIDATSPAFAVEITPQFFVGAALNVYQESPFQPAGIRSRTSVDYRATRRADARISNAQTTRLTTTTTGSVAVPPAFPFPGFTLDFPENFSSYGPFETRETLTRSETRLVEGRYTQTDHFDDVHGLNSTLGAMLTMGEKISVGIMADLPWDAETIQRQRISNRQDIFTGDRSRLLETIIEEHSESHEAAFEFPLHWAAGMSVRWTPSFLSSLDIAQTQWSDFSYRIRNKGRFNPFDGTPHGENPVDDTWTARVGLEHIFYMRDNEVPIRAGLVMEERPAIGSPDRYAGFSLGSGLGVHSRSGTWLIDVAYNYLEADNVQTVLPDTPALSSDTQQHHVFISVIWHPPPPKKLP